jgi:hypothetical protein
MAENFKRLANLEVPAVATAVYTVPGVGVDWVILKHMRVVSTDLSFRYLTLWHTNGGAPTDADKIQPATRVDDEGWGEWEGTINLQPGDKIYAMADVANALTLSLYGAEVLS